MTYIETHRTNDLQDFQSRNIKTDIYRYRIIRANILKHSPGGVSTVIQKHILIEMLSFFRNGVGTNLIKLADDRNQFFNCCSINVQSFIKAFRCVLSALFIFSDSERLLWHLFKQLCNGVHGAAHKISVWDGIPWSRVCPQIGSLSNMRKEESRTRGPSTSLSQLGAPDLSAFCAQTQTWVMGLRVWEMGKV